MKRTIGLIVVIAFAASISLAALPGFDGFESGHTPNSALSYDTWSSVGCVVTGTAAYGGSYGVHMGSSSAATNTLVESATTAWTEFHMKPALGGEPSSPATGTSAVLFYFNADGYITYHNSNDWVVANKGLQGANISAIANGTWARIGIYQNFNQDEYALFLNGTCIAQDIPFPAGDKNSYASLVIENVESNAVFDNVDIVAVAESLTETATANMNEMDSNGYIARTLYVNGTGNEYPNYSSITAALAVARNGDIIDVGSGDYSSEAVTISSGDELTALEFTGEAFTVASLTTDGVALTFAQAVTVNGAMTMNAALTANGTLTLGSLDMDADLTLAASADLNISGTLDITSSATLTAASNCDISADTLNMTAGTLIDVTSGTLSASVSLDGTFQIEGTDWATWGGSGISAQSLDMIDNFDIYAENAELQNMGFFGWGASSANVKIQSTVAHSNNAVILPDGTSASNLINDAATAVWTTYRLRPMVGAAPEETPTVSGKSFMSYVNTNGNMVIAEGGAWVECTQNLAPTPGAAPTLATDTWRRVAIYQNFTTDKFALFVADGDDNLVAVKQEVALPDGDFSKYAAFIIENTSNNAYLDDVRITTTAPTGSADLDGDGIDDTVEINLKGHMRGGRGTIFRFI